MKQDRDPQVEQFLRRATRGIWSRRARAEVRAELEDHLEAARERWLSDGLSPQAALERALAEMGDARRLSLELAQSHRPAWLSLPFLAAAASGAIVILAMYFAHATGNAIEASRIANRTIISRHQDAFLDDLKHLQAHPAFAPSRARMDAGPFLNPRIKWSYNASDPRVRRNLPFILSNPGLSLSAADLKILHTWGNTWLEHASDAPRTDLSWLSELREHYDYWDIFAWSPMNEALQEKLDDLPWSMMPLPDFEEIQAAAKLRLLRGLHDRKMIPALNEVRHLARLANTTETLVGSMVAIALLNTERKGYEKAVSLGIMKSADWQPVSFELAMRARRAFYGFPQLFTDGGPEGLNERFLGAIPATPGLCTAMFEAEGIALHMRAVLSYQTLFPGETNLAAHFERINRAVERAPCRLTYARIAESRPKSVAKWADDLSWTATWLGRMRWRIFGKIPYLRQWQVAQGTAAGYFEKYNSSIPASPNP